MKRQAVRIIGGKFRGRKLYFPDISGLRPTSDRVRETLFNWLMHDIRGATVLDAFSGSGALGFEAASRGASKVVMVEISNEAASMLRKQSTILKSNNIDIICQDVLHYLQKTSAVFDIVFLDPPFNANLLQPSFDILLERKLLIEGGMIYVETSANTLFDCSAMTLEKEKKAGKVSYRLYKR